MGVSALTLQVFRSGRVSQSRCAELAPPPQPLPARGRGFALLTLAALALNGCASGVGFGGSGGTATYDDIKAANQACAAKGGKLRLQKNGDPQYLDDYACEKK